MSKKPFQKNINDDKDLTSKIFLIYKKKCDINGIQVSPFMKQTLEQATESGVLQHFKIADELGSNHARAFMEALYEIKYDKLKTLRIWKADFGDQGLRVISKYLLVDNSLELLDLLDNSITSLGCQFLGKSLTSSTNNIRQIKLDNNLIGADGLKLLSVGLRSIQTLDKLSLKYCNIDTKGAKYIQQIIANINSKLRSLKLQGNPLENEGCFQVLKAIRNCGQTLEKLNLADIKMNLLSYNKQIQNSLENKIKQQILSILKNNILLIKFQCSFNLIHNEIAKQMLVEIQISKNIKKITFPTNVKYELRDALDSIIRARNKKNKKTIKAMKK